MSHYRPYPAYKDSGVEWLGMVPEHWDELPLKYVIDRIDSGTSVNATDTPARDGKLGVLKTSCVYSGQFDPNENKEIVHEEYGRVSCPLQIGSLIVSRMNTPDLVGAAGLVTHAPKGIFLPDRLWQISFSNALPSFAYYWTQSAFYRAQVKMVCTGTSSSMQNLSQDQFRDFTFIKPSIEVQQTIVIHLNLETARIDALVSKKTRFIGLLREKRQALITHAVTKGLDPNVKMKDSGVEWLGDVPDHWSLQKIKWLASLQSGDFITSESIDSIGTYPVFGGNGLRGYTESYTHEGRLVLIGRQGALCGNINYSYGKFWASEHAVVVRPYRNVDTTWLGELLRTMNLNQYSIASAQPGLAVERIIDLYVAIPSINEQVEIGLFIGHETNRIDTLITKTERSIDLLKERRSALITAAVTGQIDLREAI